MVALGEHKHIVAVSEDAGVYHNGTRVPLLDREAGYEVYRSSGGYYDLMLTNTSETYAGRSYGISAINEGDVITLEGVFSINGFHVTFGECKFKYQDGAWVQIKKGDTSDIVCTDMAEEAAYLVENESGAYIDNVFYEKGSLYSAPGAHSISYIADGYLYERVLIIFKYGDVNLDSRVSVQDVMAVKKTLAGVKDLGEIGNMSGDFNLNEEVTAQDLKLMREYMIMGEDATLILAPQMGDNVTISNELLRSIYDSYYLGIMQRYADSTDLYLPQPVKLNWISADRNASYVLQIANNKELSGAKTYELVLPEYEWNNLVPGTTYYWQVTTIYADGTEKTTDVQNFTTDDFATRTVTIDGISNTRDLGGYETIDGKHVKYGTIFRCAKPDEVTATGVEQILELGIKTRVDLRGSQGDSANAVAALDEVVTRVHKPGAYSVGGNIGIDTEAGMALLKEELLVFTEADNYPILYHCSAGRDRTGALSYLLLSLAGVEEKDLFFDYELSFLSKGGYPTGSSTFSAIINTCYGINAYIEGLDGETHQEKTRTYMKQVGLTDEQIDAIYDNIVE